MFRRAFKSRSKAKSGSNGQPAGSTVMDSQYKIDKQSRLKKGTNSSSMRDPAKLSRLHRSLTEREESNTSSERMKIDNQEAQQPNVAPSPIVTVTIGSDGRLFAAHEDVLCQSPFFEQILRKDYAEAPFALGSRKIALPDEEPEVFSTVLEYLYKGDYYPRLLHNKQRNSWELEDCAPFTRRGATPHASPAMGHDNHHHGSGRHGSTSTGGPSSPQSYQPPTVDPTVHLSSTGSNILRDTVVYCAAGRYGLQELKRLALRKQGLQCGIDVGTILRSAQYCYAHTPDSDSRLRAHYLALIIRCRKTFKKSGTMQAEMEKGGQGSKLYFDLFVALCNHLDDVIEAGNKGTPRTI